MSTYSDISVTLPRVSPVSPDKCERIAGMLMGRTARMDRWIPMRKTAEEENNKQDAATGSGAKWEPTPLWKRKWSNIPGDERAMLGLGLVGGGFAGYALSRLLHRRRNKWRTLAYLLAGGGAGLLGMDKLLDSPDEKGKSWRTHHLVEDTPKKNIGAQNAAQQEVVDSNKTDWDTVQHSAAALLAVAGGVQGGLERGASVDISGRRMADNAARAAHARSNAEGIPYERAVLEELQIPASANTLKGKWYEWFTRWRDVRKMNAAERVIKGRKLWNNDGKLTGVTTDGWWGIRDPAMDVAGNAIGYGAATEIAGYLAQAIGANIKARNKTVQSAITPK